MMTSAEDIQEDAVIKRGKSYNGLASIQQQTKKERRKLPFGYKVQNDKMELHKPLVKSRIYTSALSRPHSPSRISLDVDLAAGTKKQHLLSIVENKL